MGQYRHAASNMLRDFRDDERGVGTVLSLFFAIMFLLIGGIAIDGTNLWRHHQLMQQTADVAAHSGVVQLASGNTESDARTASIAMVESNMPKVHYGNLFASTTGDIQLLSYDPSTNTVSTTGSPNAVSVTLHRDDGSANPLDTMVLRLADLLNFGTATNLSEWQLAVNGVATVAETKRCESTDGIYAKNTVTLSGDNTIGARYCVHSQDKIWLPQANTFEPTSALSMPDLADCENKCNDAANPGATAAAWETNMLLPDYSAKIEEVEASFLGTGDPAIKNAFYSGKSLETSELFNLEDAGIDTTGLITGAVVPMTEAQFESIPNLPDGLTYAVSCNPYGTGGDAELQLFYKNGGNDLRDVALISNCYIKFAKGSQATSSVILSNRDVADDAITAIEGTHIGSSTSTCDSASRSMVLAKGGMHVAADFLGSNVDIVVDGDIHFASSSSSSSHYHTGVSMHASGEISITTGHEFEGCSHPSNGMTLPLLVIRHVVPGST